MLNFLQTMLTLNKCQSMKGSNNYISDNIGPTKTPRWEPVEVVGKSLRVLFIQGPRKVDNWGEGRELIH